MTEHYVNTKEPMADHYYRLLHASRQACYRSVSDHLRHTDRQPRRAVYGCGYELPVAAAGASTTATQPITGAHLQRTE